VTAQPAGPEPSPDTGAYEVIHLGDQAAVVVPLADFMRLRALERLASAEELEDAEDTAALQDWKAREAAGQTSYVPADEVRRRLGLARSACGSSTRRRRSTRRAGFLADDPGGLSAVLDAIDQLASDPRPAGSFPYGSPDLRRLRVGRYRVMYEIKSDVVSIGHIARRTPDR
jgi:mRNA interferase RelE/StbE